MSLTIKLASNLFRKGDYIISYETVVAKIVGNKLYELGKYSRTTSKHICKVASLYNLQVIKSEKRGNFWKLEKGAQCEIEGCLSPSLSKKIKSHLSSTSDFVVALAKIGKFSNEDWTKISSFLKGIGISEEQFEHQKQLEKLNQILDFQSA